MQAEVMGSHDEKSNCCPKYPLDITNHHNAKTDKNDTDDDRIVQFPANIRNRE